MYLFGLVLWASVCEREKRYESARERKRKREREREIGE